MKYLFIILVSLCIYVNSYAKMTLSGTIKNSTAYNYLFIHKIIGQESSKVDSVKIINGTFEYKPKVDLPRGFYRLILADKINWTVILESAALKFTADAANVNDYTITGSIENDLFLKYVAINNNQAEGYKKLEARAMQLNSIRNSDPATYELEFNKLNLALDTLNRRMKTDLMALRKNNPQTFMSKVAGMFAFEDSISAKYFFTDAEKFDEELARGEMLSNKCYQYLNRYYPNGSDFKSGINSLLSNFTKNNLNKEIAYSSSIRAVFQYDQKFARKLTEQYHRDFPHSTYTKFFLDNVPKGAPEVGETPPDIRLKDLSGKEIALSSLKGKVVLLDFWASWCGPCRKENPNVVLMYNKYKELGFTVYSVSLDQNKDAWQTAILKDGLAWENHVSDLKGWNSDAAKLYGVNGIPATFLIGKDGKIIGANLRGPDLERALYQQFGQ